MDPRCTKQSFTDIELFPLNVNETVVITEIPKQPKSWRSQL